MAQSFDDFAHTHAADKDDRTRLTAETKVEYEILKGFISQFAIDGKGLGNQKFDWSNTLTGRPMLVLGNVAVVLLTDGERGGVPQNMSARFTRKPAGSMQAYADDSSPLADATWSLEPEIFKGNFVWFVFERAARYGTASLAQEIAKKLAQYHIEYEQAYGREV